MNEDFNERRMRQQMMEAEYDKLALEYREARRQVLEGARDLLAAGADVPRFGSVEAADEWMETLV